MVTEYTNICFICGRPKEHTHHLINGTGLRKLCDEDGLTAPVCNECHTFIHSHGSAEALCKIIGQMEFEKTRTREQFRKRYGRSYL